MYYSVRFLIHYGVLGTTFILVFESGQKTSLGFHTILAELALPAIRSDIELLKKLIPLVHTEPTPELTHALTSLGHAVADTIISSAAAAYTVSIQHFERWFL